jgi:hypothetical protein
MVNCKLALSQVAMAYAALPGLKRDEIPKPEQVRSMWRWLGPAPPGLKRTLGSSTIGFTETCGAGWGLRHPD